MRTQNFIPTERDTGMLVELGNVGLMSTAMLVTRYFTGFKKQVDADRAFRRRLRGCQSLGIIDSATMTVRDRGRNLPLTIHTLTESGAEFVAELTHYRPQRPGSSLDLSPLTLPHRLGVIATRLAFEDAHRAAGLPLGEWIHEYDLMSGAKLTAPNEAKFVLYESYKSNGKRYVCWPDAAARIRLPIDGGHELLAYIEYDRSTETTKQFAAKVPGYRLLVAEERYRRHWPAISAQHIVRVLVVVRSQDRLGNLIEAIRGKDGAELFRFATYADLQAARLLTQPIWHSVDGQVLPILRTPAATVNAASFLARSAQN